MNTSKLDNIQILQKSLTDLKKMQKSLNRSMTICKTIDLKKAYTEADEDVIDNLISRFGRLTDFLINKVYRNIDKIEYTTEGNLLDLFNRAHKRNLINSIGELKEIKELINLTSHEYTDDDLNAICETVFNHIPALFDCINKVITYCQKNHNCS